MTDQELNDTLDQLAEIYTVNMKEREITTIVPEVFIYTAESKEHNNMPFASVTIPAIVLDDNKSLYEIGFGIAKRAPNAVCIILSALGDFESMEPDDENEETVKGDGIVLMAHTTANRVAWATIQIRKDNGSLRPVQTFYYHAPQKGAYYDGGITNLFKGFLKGQILGE